MPENATGIAPEKGDVIVMVGTTKGAFLLRSNANRRDWEIDGPHFPGEEVYALLLDQRGGRRSVWASPGNPFFGTSIVRSDDFGATWSEKEERRVAFPEGSGISLKRIWQI